jgi:uncharacterized phiE125 gp8 family phage protein
MSLVITTDPAVEPISVDEAKTQANVYFDEDNDFIGALITAAREVSEAATWRQFITASFALRLNDFPLIDKIELPRPPLQSVESITYTDTDGAEQTLATSVYTVDTYNTPGRVLLKYGQDWPATRGDRNNVVINFTAGYGDTSAAVPATAKQAILMRTAHWYQHREPTVAATIANVPEGPKFLDSRLRFRHRFDWADGDIGTL